MIYDLWTTVSAQQRNMQHLQVAKKYVSNPSLKTPWKEANYTNISKWMLKVLDLIELLSRIFSSFEGISLG